MSNGFKRMPAGDCTCDSQCGGPEITDCTCIWTAHNEQCVCLCKHPVPLPPEDAVRMPPDTRIAIDTRGDVTVARFAEVLAAATGHKLLIPAERASEKVSIKDDYTNIADVMKRVGLIMGE